MLPQIAPISVGWQTLLDHNANRRCRQLRSHHSIFVKLVLPGSKTASQSLGITRTLSEAHLVMPTAGVHSLQKHELRTLSAFNYGRWGEDAECVAELIKVAHKRQRESRDQIFTNNLPFSWARFLGGFASLVLVCSDIPRSGLGFRDFSSMFLMVEPDVLQSFGPWYYSVQKLTKTTANTATGKVWSYKYDSTSVSWRAFAEFYKLDTFPPCVMYRERCAGETLSGTTVFNMLDSIVNATSEYGKSKTQSHQSSSTTKSYSFEPVSVILRTESSFLDRLHHYLAPQLFVNKIWRTNQAIYYPPEFLRQKGVVSSICFGVHATRPFFCHELWANFRRSCAKRDKKCQEIGLVWAHTVKRLREVEHNYPGLQVDLTFLESQEDQQRCIGGISLAGVQKSDIATIVRARQCNHTTQGDSCETVFVDEYRYQIGLVVSDALQWYRVVSTLRIIGQVYFYLRVGLLLLFCYRIQPVNKSSVFMRLQKASILFMRTPVQSVIFGCPLPILCYVCAHLIDAPVTYEILSKKFTTQGGVFTMHFRDFCLVAFIQMRNLWILAAALHGVVAIATSRWELKWYPVGGILGIPEFLLGGLSCLTILAQFRSTTYRWTKVHSIFEMEQSAAQQEIKYRYQFGHRGSGNTQLGGILIDVKFFFFLLVVAFTIVFLRNFSLQCSRYMGVRTKTNMSPWVLRAKSPVPYSAGIMWPILAMCVHWSSDYYFIPAALSVDDSTQNPGAIIPLDARVVKKTSLKLSQVRDFVSGTITAISPTVLMSASAFELLQFQMEKLHQRQDAYDANVALINLVCMSDPLYYLYYIRAGGGVWLGYYQSTRNPQKVLLLPRDAVTNYNTETHSLRLLGYVRSSQLKWSQVIHCG